MLDLPSIFQRKITSVSDLGQPPLLQGERTPAQIQQEGLANLMAAGYSPTGRLPYLATSEQRLSNEALPKVQAAAPGGHFSITPRELLQPYYGADLDNQVAQAKAAYDDRQLTTRNWAEAIFGLPHGDDMNRLTQDYSKLDTPVPVAVSAGPDAYSFYHPKHRGAVVGNALAQANMAREKAGLVQSGDKDAQDFILRNNFSLAGLMSQAADPMRTYMGTVEHEVGHSFTDGTALGWYEPDPRDRHMAKPSELANQLGRINREAYVLYGKRFDGDGLTEYLKTQVGLPADQRFEGFSPDTQRGLREIMDSYEGRVGPQIFKNAQFSIPFFVQADGQVPPVA